MPSEQTAVLVIVFAVILAFLSLLLILVFAWVFSPWLQANLLGVRVSIVQILRMRLRRVDTGAVLRALVAARQAGFDVSCADVERAQREGVDLEKLTAAITQASRQSREITFQELLEAEQHVRAAQ